MGRPLNKKYFGNRNIGTAGTTDNGIGGNGIASVTIGGVWSGFTQATSTVTFSAPQLPGGVTATGTVTITAGEPVSVTMTEKGSGYTALPTVTIADSVGGAETSGTATAVYQVDSGAVGSATNNENAIISNAKTTTGGSVQFADIIRQVSTRRFKVKTADGTLVCKLKASVATTVGEMSILAVDSDNGTYFVTKITSRKITVTQGTGTQFATGSSVPWAFGASVENTTLQLSNG